MPLYTPMPVRRTHLFHEILIRTAGLARERIALHHEAIGGHAASTIEATSAGKGRGLPPSIDDADLARAALGVTGSEVLSAWAGEARFSRSERPRGPKLVFT